MATVRVFEELEIWRMAAEQCQRVFDLMEAGCFQNDAPLSDQLNRSSGSVMDNIAEGFDRFSKADFRHFLIVARGSNAEVRSQLHRATSRNYISAQASASLLSFARQLGIKINSLIRYLDQSNYNAKPKPGAKSVEEPDTPYGATTAPAHELPEAFLASS